MVIGFLEAFQLGKKCLRLPSGRKGLLRNQHPPPKNSKPGELMDPPAGEPSPRAKVNLLPMLEKEVASWGAGKKDLLMTGRKERGSGLQGGGSQATFPKIPIDQRLLNSFPERKNAELREYSRDAEVPKPGLEAEEQMAVVFFLTRKLLSKTAAPLDYRLLRDDSRMERALEKVHPQLPLSVRLVLRKKRYIRFMLDHRERLIP